MSFEYKKLEDIDEIISNLLPEVTDGTLIDGGHYLIEEDKNGQPIHLLNNCSTASFEAAINLYAQVKNQGVNVTLCFLVADLAIESIRRKKFNQQFQLPQEYYKILYKHGVKEQEIIFFYESNLRNRAFRTLKKQVNAGRVIEYCNSFRLNPSETGSAKQVSNLVCNSIKRVPNCRMILTQKLKDGEEQGFTKLINFHAKEAFKCGGSFASVYQNLLEGNLDVINVYFLSDGTLEIQRYKAPR